MNNSALLSGSYFAAFTMFLFYQQKLSRDFKGASQAFHLFLSVFAFAGYLAQITYFLYYGWSISWVGAFLIFLASLLVSGIGGAILERLIDALLIVIIGFLAIPILGYLMFKAMPITN